MRGLDVEESLIFEKKSKVNSATDLPKANSNKNMTGLKLRDNINIPNISEPQIVRHFVRLSRYNYSIDHGFLPLGSCTMKHNPRLNEKLARIEELSRIHPYQDESMIQGALEIIYDLQNWLKELSGLNSVTLNPAAGAHGEFAGIKVIRKCHLANGRNKKYVLVPDSAHGTNPATAAICGYKVKTIKTGKDGIVDIDSLKEAIDDDVAALMLTNPNTCGKFELFANEISSILKKHNAYFYCDGANFNAIVGKIKPAEFGVDVMHFNLHKTFSTPHGGGGPGSGPIAVSKELATYLPVPYIVKKDGKFTVISDNPSSIGRIKSFYGQFGMFVRALSYMLSHGKDGLKQVAEDAVLNANYILASLKDNYDVPYKGFCMHECLITDKKQKEKSISTNHIAKALIEYGIHPMTVYFPLVVQGAMLIEPTETESKETLDEFIDIMNNISQMELSEIEKFPVSSPRKKLDEVKAARNPVLSYLDIDKFE